MNFPNPAEQPGLGDYDFTGINAYSDLDITQWDLTLNANHRFTDRWGLDLGGAYRVYDDNEPYLYDTSGKLWVVNAGVSYWF